MESDRQIPVIYQENRGAQPMEIKKKYVNFLGKFQSDVNDFGGKVAKVIEILGGDFKTLALMMKYFNSQKIRKLLQKVTSCWVIETTIKNTCKILLEKEKSKNLSKFFKFLSIFNFSRIRDIDVLKVVSKVGCILCGRYVIEDKYILQILQKNIEKLEKNFKGNDTALEIRMRVFNKAISLLYSYFGILGNIQKSVNIEFLRNYYSCLNIILALSDNFATIKTLKKRIKKFIVVEQKKSFYETFLKILVINLNLFESKGTSLFNPKNKIFKKVIMDNSYQLRALKYRKQADLDPFGSRRGFKAHNSSSSSGFSTSDSSSILKRDANLSDVVKRVKMISCKLIEILIEIEKKIFLQKSNWRMIIPPIAVTKIFKGLLEEKILFPINLYNDNVLQKIEQSEGTSANILLNGVKNFIETWKGHNGQKHFDREASNFQMNDLKSKILISLRSKSSSDITLVGSFMSENDNETKEFLMKTLAKYIKAQPVDIWLKGRNTSLSKTINGFKNEVTNSMKIAIVIILLELCISKTDQSNEQEDISLRMKFGKNKKCVISFSKEEKMSEVVENEMGKSENFVLKNLLEFFEFEYLVKYMSEVVQYVLDMIILPNFDVALLASGMIDLSFRDLLCGILKKLMINREVFDGEFLEKFVDQIICEDQVWSEELYSVIIELVRVSLVDMSQEKIEKIFNLFSERSTGRFSKMKYKLLAALIEEYQEFLDEKKFSESSDLQKRVMTDEILERKKRVAYFRNEGTSHFFWSKIKNLFKSCFAGEDQEPEDMHTNLLIDIIEVIDVDNLNFLLEIFKEKKSEIVEELISSLAQRDQIKLIEKFLRPKNLNLEQSTEQIFWVKLLNFSANKKNLFDVLLAISSIFTHRKTDIEVMLEDNQMVEIFNISFNCLQKRSRKYVVNSLKIINLILVNTSDDILTRIFEQEDQEVTQLSLIDILDHYLSHKFPKYSWNTAYIINDVLNKDGKMSLFHKEFNKEMIDFFKNKVVDLYLQSPNIKLKYQLGCVILNRQFGKELAATDFEEILNFCESLEKREWEEKNLPSYKVISTLSDLKDQAVDLVVSSALRLFKKYSKENKEEILVADISRCFEIFVGFAQKILDKVRQSLEEKGVVFGHEDQDLGKFKSKKKLMVAIDKTNDTALLDLFDCIDILAKVIHSEDDIEYCPIELNKLSLFGRRRVVGKKSDRYILYSIDNIFAVEAMTLDE